MALVVSQADANEATDDGRARLELTGRDLANLFCSVSSSGSLHVTMFCSDTGTSVPRVGCNEKTAHYGQPPWRKPKVRGSQ